MDKFTTLWIKQNGEWQVYGKPSENVDTLKKKIQKITNDKGELTRGKEKVRLEAARLIHCGPKSARIIASRKFR